MRVKLANVDSLNVNDLSLWSIIDNHPNYTLEVVKSQSIFNSLRWKQFTGKNLQRSIKEAEIIHNNRGVELPLKLFARSRSPTLEFFGLAGYTDKSEERLLAFRELKQYIQHTKVTRLDICIDYPIIPSKVLRELKCHRIETNYKSYPNTTYYKSKLEGKTNSYFDIKIYNKQIQANLSSPTMRLEFCFKSAYTKGYTLKEIENLYRKCERTIKKITGITVKIESI